MYFSNNRYPTSVVTATWPIQTHPWDPVYFNMCSTYTSFCWGRPSLSSTMVYKPSASHVPAHNSTDRDSFFFLWGIAYRSILYFNITVWIMMLLNLKYDKLNHIQCLFYQVLDKYLIPSSTQLVNLFILLHKYR